jgi:hypothetical protein
MNACIRGCVFALMSAVAAACLAQDSQDEHPRKVIRIDPRPIGGDKSVNYDYDIVYCRSPRWVEEHGRKRPARWAEFGHPFAVAPGTDLMLLRPDGSEELLVAGGEGSIQDPYVSFDGEWVFYTHFHQAGSGHNAAGADIYKVHVKSKKIVRLTEQQFTANKEGVQPNYGVYNIHPCPVPGGKVAFVSNRNAYLPPPKSYPTLALQLHLMDEDGGNIETVGHLNLGCALHPVILKDGRLLFSSLENMGLRASLLWGIWSIHPDGANWAPVVSAFSGTGAPSAFHFQTQLSDENIIIELYYNQNQKGFGTLFKIPPQAPAGQPAFGPGNLDDPRNPRWQFLNDRGQMKSAFQLAVHPLRDGGDHAVDSNARSAGAVHGGRRSELGPHWQGHPSLRRAGQPSAGGLDAGADRRLGRRGAGSHGAAAHRFGIVSDQRRRPTDEPAQMLLIKNDPQYNEQWPRPVVPYSRIYGVDEPQRLEHKNDGGASPHLPEGTPFGLVGTSSLYKRESAPLGDRSLRRGHGGVPGRLQGTWEAGRFLRQPLELARPGRRCGPLRQPRHPRDSHRLLRTERPRRRRGERPRLSRLLQPRHGAAADLGGDTGAEIRQVRTRSRSTPTAIRTPAFWRRFPRTWRIRFKRSTSGEWCSTWLRRGIRSAPARNA